MKKDCEFCSKSSNRRDDGFTCPYCGKVWNLKPTKKPKSPKKKATKNVHAFHVRFRRELEQDLDIAKGNYPKLPTENEQLAAQCVLEVEANPKFKGRCMVESLRRRGPQYFVQAVMTYEGEADRDKARLSFCKQLQRCYDRGGMAGFFKIKD